MSARKRSAGPEFVPSPPWLIGDWITYVDLGSKQYAPKGLRVWKAKEAPKYTKNTGSGFEVTAPGGAVLDSAHFRVAASCEVAAEIKRLARRLCRLTDQVTELNDAYVNMQKRGIR